MPWRFIIEGSWDPPRHDHDGFFTTRRGAALAREDAAEQVLAALEREWRTAPCLPDGGKGLNLTIVDGWRIGWSQWFRAPNAGHSFHVDGARSDTASFEAKVARAPKNAAIWRLATEME